MKTFTRNAKTLLATSLVVGIVAFATSCKKEGCTDEKATNYDEKAKEDDGTCEYDTVANGEVTVTGEITENTTWTANNIYYLDGKVIVTDGVTLTSEPGTIIKGKEGLESLASALVVAQGGMLMAEGTADSPIIFTSELDDITYGEKVGTSLEKTDNEKWGGVVILGKAPVSTENGDITGNIEGLPVDEGYGAYGGDDEGDNSGVLSYVSIRHCGVSIGEGNELNALTLGGVGFGTSISNIEIYGTLDDGIECFGGTVDISNALVFYQGDDAIDLDQNYSGTISDFAVVMGDGIGTDEAFEVDGPEGSTHTSGKFTLTNGYVMNEGSEGSPADFKSKAQGTVRNITFDFTGDVKLRASFEDDCTEKSDAAKYVATDVLVFDNCSMAGVEVYENADVETCVDGVAASQTAAEGKISTDGAGSTIDVGNDFSWTAAAIRGEI